jgi:hypothetical protein
VNDLGDGLVEELKVVAHYKKRAAERPQETINH